MEKLRFSEFCANCRKNLNDAERILFVEKEVGRCFCTEECIHEYFLPTVDFMKEDLAKLRSSNDFTEEDSEKLQHYQFLTLEDPDEVWMDERESGERHFTFISYFRHGEDQFKYVVVCLTLTGDPSYVFLSFPSRDEDLIDNYRKGTDLKIQEDLTADPIVAQMEQAGAQMEQIADVHFISDGATGFESALEDSASLLEYLKQARHPEDIAVEDHSKFNVFIDHVLDEPDEIWMHEDAQKNRICTFSSRFFDESVGGFEMVVITRLNPSNVNAIDVVLAFPTIDANLSQKFKRGMNSLNKAFGIGWASGRAA